MAVAFYRFSSVSPHAPCQCIGSSCSATVRLPAARPSPLRALLRVAAILSFLPRNLKWFLIVSRIKSLAFSMLPKAVCN